MNIHQAAKRLIAMETLPEITGTHDDGWRWNHGLCSALKQAGCATAYESMGEHMKACDAYTGYLPLPGFYTEQRLNLIALLACTTPKDFE